MIDPQYNILYWGSKWIFHTVCWGAVGCDWGVTFVYFGITYVCFIPSRLPVFAVEPKWQHELFYFCPNYHLKDTHRIFKKNHVGLKLECDWELLLFEVLFSCPFYVLLGANYANMLVTTQCSLKRALHLTSHAWVCVVWKPESLLKLSALWI